jgi:hypothetical protein
MAISEFPAGALPRNRQPGFRVKADREQEESAMAEVLLWPFKMLWHLTMLVLNLTGRLLAIVIGLVLVVVGVVLAATVIGAILGVPMVIFGAALVLRGLF